MREKLKENFKSKKSIVSLVIGATTLLLSVIGATYAYFSVIAYNEATNTDATGSLASTGNVTLTTNTPNLYLNLNAVLMSQDNISTEYYATTNTDGVPITEPTLNNGIYTLATAELSGGETRYNCTYNYNITGSLTRAITDGSDEDIKVTISGDSIENGSVTYTLKQILEGNVTVSGTFENITTGNPQTITVESKTVNTSNGQNDLEGNSYTISITPQSGSDGFSCEALAPLSRNLAQRLIEEDKMWQSGLEGDGYRFIGSGNANASTSPDNFICFGTTDVTECKNNEEKYLYRMIGVFKDTSNQDSVKLIKYKQLPTAKMWHSDIEDLFETSVEDIDFDEQINSIDMYNDLNGSYFLTNPSYNYLQNSTWTNKIANWTWSAVNTKSLSDGPRYSDLTTQNIYLHEMNRTTKTSIVGIWTTLVAKIGLMYASDYQMSLGSSSLSLTSYDYPTLVTGWMHQSNNDTTASPHEWTISRSFGRIDDNGVYVHAWYVDSNGYIYIGDVYNAIGARPVFYLTPDVEYGSGTGDYANPIIIG